MQARRRRMGFLRSVQLRGAGFAGVALAMLALSAGPAWGECTPPDCDDDNPCTWDSCEGSTCVHVAHEESCSNGD
jgi:hypothetical protein